MSQMVPPQILPRKKRNAIVKGYRELADFVDTEKKKYGFNSRTKFVLYAIQQLEEKEGQLPVARYESVFDPILLSPVQIVGLPGSGKTTTAKELYFRLRDQGVPCLVIDPLGDWKEITRHLEPLEAISTRWYNRPGSYRIALPADREVAKTEVRLLMEALDRIQNTKVLRNHVVIVDESHRFRAIAPFVDFLRESRKWVRKTIICVVDRRLFGEICFSMRPLPKFPQKGLVPSLGDPVRSGMERE